MPLRLFTLLLLSSVPLFLTAQTTVGRWGKVSDEDMEATSYQFAPGADAIYLFDYGQWVPHNLEQGSARLAHHYQIKILTEEGLRYAERVIGFAKDERVSGLRAQVHYLDPEKGKHRKNLLKVGSLPDSTLSADSLAKVFLMSGAGVGSVLEVRYSLVTPHGDVLRPWYFQQDIPVKYSEIQLSAFDPLTFRTKTLPDDFAAYSRNRWIRRYSPATPRDPYLLNPDDHRLQIRFQLLPWETLTIKEEWQDLSYALEVGTLADEKVEVLEALGSLALSLTRQAVTQEEKVANIVRHLQKYMTWNGVYSESVSGSPGAIYKSRTGNSADINMLLFLLLESAGLEPSRVFTSTRDHGTTIDQPFWGQFNHLVVRCQVDGQVMLLDATEPDLDYLWFPLNSANGRGWEIADTTTQWVPLTPSPGSRVQHVLTLQLAEDGAITGHVKESYLGYPELAWHKKFDVSGFQLSPADPYDLTLAPRRKSPVVTDFPAKSRQAGFRTADTMVIPLDLYGWARQLPDIREGRALPVEFSYPMKESVLMQLELPEGWELQNSVASRIVMFGDGLTMEIQATQMENILQISWQNDRDQAAFEPSLNVDLAKFFAEARQRLATELILVK